MSFRVHVTRPIPEAGLEVLRRAGISVSLPSERGLPPRQQLLDACRDVDGIVSLLTEKIDREVFEGAPRLKAVCNMAVGYDNIDVAEASRRGILVCNTPGVLTETTADFAWGLMLAVARRLVEGHAMVSRGEFDAWGPLMLLGRDLFGSTLGLVGMGRIGRAVARRAVGFGMKVVFCSGPNAPARIELGPGCEARRVEFEELLAQSDYVSLHTPLTEATHHLIDAQALGRMKPTAFLINTSRGPVVDEGALVEALNQGRLAGAGLDVFEREPEVHPGLFGLPGVVLAPHAASASVATRDSMATMATSQMVDVLEGRHPAHAVRP
ncbi:MAG: D-glycerate dehydrogenase [Candidatus Eremiobacteraeota bacterium]|nr:D-glycerate dehydrogenase [Candidatus Eremiobacteraeota bacterium]